MDEIEQFKGEVERNITRLGKDRDVQALSRIWVREIARHKYAYNFSWMGRPIIQFPQDMIAMQQLVWETRPDLIIETGIAHGGSLVMNASYLMMLDYCDAATSGNAVDHPVPRRRIVGIDIDIRPHNRKAIEAHPMAARIQMIEGSSIDEKVVAEVRRLASQFDRVLVILDSNHTHTHVLNELRAYAPLVSVGSYCVVFDTLIEEMPDELCGDRPWGIGNNPMTAVNSFLKSLDEGIVGSDGCAIQFEIDSAIDHKLLISAAPRGYLRRVA